MTEHDPALTDDDAAPGPEKAAPRARERVVHLLYGSGGGGHLASAQAMAAALATSGHGVRGELVNASAIAGALPGDALYNLFLSYNAVPLIEILNAFAVSILPIVSPAVRSAFRAYWTDPPDAVISFVPMLNRVFAQALPRGVPLFTVLTDFSDTSGHPWLQHPRQHIVAGTDIAVRQAVEAGYRERGAGSDDVLGTGPCLTRTTGMVVHPRFYITLSRKERAKIVEENRFDPALPTVLVLYGGSPPTEAVTRLFDLLVARTGREAVNVLIVCGRNSTLYERLKARVAEGGIQRAFIEGYTRDIPALMQLADIMIGKPGPGVVSEAFVSLLPMLLVTGENDTNVMKQEKDVLAWVRESGVGLVVRTPEEAATVSHSQMELMRDNIKKLPRNTAVYEVLNLLLSSLHLPTTGVQDAIDAFRSAPLSGLRKDDNGSQSNTTSSTASEEEHPQSVDIGAH